jgi:hypothetical protein
MSGEEWDFDDNLEITLFEYNDEVSTMGEAMREAEVEHLELSKPEYIDFDMGTAAHWPIGEAAGTSSSDSDPEDVHQFVAYSEQKRVRSRGPQHVPEEEI